MTESLRFSPQQKRVILTGPTGVDHDAVMRHLEQYLVKTVKLHSGSDVRHYSLEGMLPDKMTVPGLLDAHVDDEHIRAKWREAFQELCKDVVSDDARIAIVSLHSTWYRSSRILSPVNFDVVRELRPCAMVTIVDDLYSTWHRIVSGERAHKHKRHTASYLTLGEICNWRWAEVMISDVLARTLGLRNFVVATKHPVRMLYRLLFAHDDFKKIYACIPISDTRSSPGSRSEVDAIRRQLHEQFIVFDPLALDDKVLAVLLDDQYGFHEWHDPGKPTLYGRPLVVREASASALGRWPAMASDDPHFAPLCPDPLDSITVDAGEAVEVCRSHTLDPPRKSMREIQDSVVDDHIRLRDFRLIADADALAAYRPQYKGKSPGGQQMEIHFARDINAQRGYGVVVYHDPKADGDLKGGPFAFILERYCVFSMEEWWNRLRELNYQ